MTDAFSNITANTGAYQKAAFEKSVVDFAATHGDAFLLVEDFAAGSLLPAKTNPFVISDFSEPTLSKNSLEKMSAGTGEIRPADVERQFNPRCMSVYPLVRRPESTVSFISLGRTPNNDVVLQHPSVSRFHAYFRKSGYAFVVQDAGSANGTSVEGISVPAQGEGQPISLLSGSELLVGAVYAIFLTAETFVEFVRGRAPNAAQALSDSETED